MLELQKKKRAYYGSITVKQSFVSAVVKRGLRGRYKTRTYYIQMWVIKKYDKKRI